MNRFTEKMLKESIVEVNQLMEMNESKVRFILSNHSSYYGYNEKSVDSTGCERNGERGTPREVNDALWSRARGILAQEKIERLQSILSDLVKYVESNKWTSAMDDHEKLIQLANKAKTLL